MPAPNRRRFPLQLVDFEGVFLDAPYETADKAKVKWELVLQTDTQAAGGRLGQADDAGRSHNAGRRDPVAGRRQDDARHLLRPAGSLQPEMDLLSRLSQRSAASAVSPTVVTLPGDNQAMIDGKPVPLTGPGQRTRILRAGFQNLHAPVETESRIHD
ncbi:MAG: hypothetical protein R3C02_07805 [Planctomycetaceae bacterium]